MAYFDLSAVESSARLYKPMTRALSAETNDLSTHTIFQPGQR